MKALELSEKLQQKHLRELTQIRGLYYEWAEANCRSITASEASNLLGYKVESDGIWLQGKGKQGQFKPDLPFVDKNGRAAKYVTPKGDYDAVIPELPQGAVWNPYCIKGQSCLILTEGIFKAIAASAIGYPTLALLGVEMGMTPADADPEGRRWLVETLRALAQQGYGFILAFDADIARKPAVKRALETLTFNLLRFQVPVYHIPPWDENLGKGIDDYIQLQGARAFEELLRTAVPYEPQKKKKYRKLRAGELLDFLEEHYRERLRFNQRLQRVELDGEEIESLWTSLLREQGIEAAKVNVDELCLDLAKRNPYDPVKDYLERVTSSVEPLALDRLASRYLGTTNPLYDLLLKKTLIAAVARIYEPGCKFDYALVLQGEQWAGKSHFFEILAGEWHDGSMGNGSDKDELLKLHQCWIQEWGEIERVFGKKAQGEIKAFLSRRVDTFRVPYGRVTKSHPRRSIIVGTVNPADFLMDQTGDRRFWVIPVEKVNTALLEKERDAVWAAAVAAYRKGEPFNPTREENALILANNEQFRAVDEWEAMVGDFLKDKPRCFIAQILEQVFDLEPAKMEKATQMRVSAILQKLGWRKVGQREIEGRRVQAWEPNKKVEAAETLDRYSPSQPLNLSQPESQVETSESLATQGISQPLNLHTENSKLFFKKNISVFSDFPHRTSSDIFAKRNRGTRIANKLLMCNVYEDIEACRVMENISVSEMDWVMSHLLESERNKIEQALVTHQPDLFSHITQEKNGNGKH